MSTSHFYRACTLCEASCGLDITVENGAITQIRGDVNDPMSRGYVCPKGVAWGDIHSDPDRLRHPLRRLPSGEWVDISWNEAFDLVAQRLVDIRRRSGDDSIGMYLGNPITHGWAPVVLIPQLLSALGTRNRYSAASIDQQPQHLLAYLLFGSPLLLPVPDIDRTDFLLVIGGNPLVSNGSIMTAPNMRRRLTDLRNRGGRLIVVDPRRTETARLADQHVFIRPGSDVFLLASMVQVLFAEGLTKPGRAGAYVRGINSLRPLMQQFTPEATEQHTGVPPNVVRQLARDFAAAPTGAVYARLGVCQSEFGTVAYWLIHVLNILTGRLDEVGGWMFAEPAFDLPVIGARTTSLIGYDRWRSRVRGMPEFAAEFPVVTLADEILEPGEGQIKAMVLVAGNPVLSTPDGRRLDTALESLEFCVAIDFYLNESNRHADVILPPTAALERDEFDVVFPAVSVRNQVRWGEAVLTPDADTRSDADILMELLWRVQADRVGDRRAKLLHRARRALMPKRFIDIALRIGPHGMRPGRKGLSLAEVAKNPHGLDLGALRPVLPKRLMTPGSIVPLDHPVVINDWARVTAALHTAPSRESDFDLLLIGRRHLRSNNSWMHNTARLTGGTNRCTLLMHPDDARARGVRDGSTVRIRSAVGEISAEAELTTDVMVGVVSMPHGWGHGRDGVGWTHAASTSGESVNDITDATRFDPVSGNAAVTALPVTVTAS